VREANNSSPKDRRPPSVRRCPDDEFEAILRVVNEAAAAYAGVIPKDRWHVPYMPRRELEDEIAAGVVFRGIEADGALAAVMGSQDVLDVTLIRHAYVRPAFQGRGLGSALVRSLRRRTKRPILVGTWRAATWAIRFYEKHEFRRVPDAWNAQLLGTYWRIPRRQVETSVVLADRRWRRQGSPAVARDREPGAAPRR
jgi:GNAT superfamily N-acetyltransferase